MAPHAESSATSTNHGITSTAQQALIFISSPWASISSSTFTSLVVAATRSSRISFTMAPPRSYTEDQHLDHPVARGVRPAPTSRSRAQGRSRACPTGCGNRANAVRERPQTVTAKVVSPWVERGTGGDGGAQVAETVGPRLLHLPRYAPAQQQPKNAHSNAATATAGTIATSTVPVRKTPTPNAARPTTNEPSVN